MPLSLSSFQAYFPENQLRGVQFLTAALMVGIGLFLITVLILNVVLVPVEAPIGATEVVTIMTVMVLISTLAMILLSRVVFQRMTSRGRLMALVDRLPDHTTEPERVEAVVSTMRLAEIVRIALLEAPAAFGLGVCVIAISMGVLKSEPLYWVNVFPTLVFFVLVVLSYPSRERFEGVLREIKMG